MVQQQRLEMRVGVVLAGAVMLVSGPRGRELFEPRGDVLDEAVLVVVDVDGGGDVHGRDEAETVDDAAALDDRLHLRRQVHHLVALLRGQRHVLGVGFDCRPCGPPDYETLFRLEVACIPG